MIFSHYFISLSVINVHSTLCHLLFPQVRSRSSSSALRPLALDRVGGGLGYYRLKSQYFGYACAPSLLICCISSVLLELRQANSRYHKKHRLLVYVQYKVTLFTINVPL